MAKQNHHYLPRGVLKRFGLGKKNKQIFFIDKQTSAQAKKTNVNNIACINNFYRNEQGSESLEDDFFRVIDDKAPKVIKKLLADINKPSVNLEDRENLILYVASQIARVPFNYNNIENILSAFDEQVHSEVSLFDEGVKSLFLRSIVENTEQYKEILSKLSITVVNTKDFELVIGDNPVMVFEHDGKTISKYGGAFAIMGKIFMMPLSPNHLLIFFDSSLKGKLYDYIQASNFWQFVNSSQYVYGNKGELLERSLKEHYDYSYDYIKNTKPELLLETELKRGDPVFIGQTLFRFEGQALEALKEYATKKLITKRSRVIRNA